MIRKFLLFGFGFLCSAMSFAQGPNGSGTYYQEANGLKASELKTALFGIISPHTSVLYKDIWTTFKSTDVTADGYIWDIYSDVTKYEPGGYAQGANYKAEGDSYNREHSLPKSWFGSAEPMYTDLFHIMPTDGWVNNFRGNYPYGEVETVSTQSMNSFSKLGLSKLSGYSGKVFEPNDEYKGDLARNYFYMATAYEDKISEWSSVQISQNEFVGNIMSGDSYTSYVKWTLDMLLRWAKNDPVSEKEVDRNSAVYYYQNNRNPYIDYPGLEQYVWGGMTEVAFSYDNYDTNIKWSETASVNYPEEVIDDDGDNVLLEFTKVSSSDELLAGDEYLIVNEDNLKALSDYGSYYTGVSVNIEGDVLKTATGSGKPHVLVLGGVEGAWTLFDKKDGKYIALNSNKNAIHQAEDVTNASLWTIDFKKDTTAIINNQYTSRQIQWNNSSPRFACYKGTGSPISLYRCCSTTSVDRVMSDEGGYWLDVYTLDGRKVKSHVRIEDAFDGLDKGIYIIDHKKFVVR